MSPFQNAIETALDVLTETDVAGTAVTYHRGEDSVSVVAAVGHSEHQAVDQYGAVVVVQSRDYLIDCDQLVIDAVQIEPQRGDLVKETIGSTVYVHEVLPFGPEADAYRLVGPFRHTYRVHTKQVGTE